MADLFISYSRRDQQFVRALVERLSAHGKECWVDWQDIPPTAEWIREIYEGIEGSDAFVFVISPESARSATCRNEIEHAEKLNKRIVPILRRGIDGAELPDAIASRNWIPLPESVDLDEAVGRLVETVERDLDQVRRHTRWLAKALEWEKGDREPSLLLRGAELRAAEEWLAGAPGREPAPTPLQYEYAQASRAAASKRQRLVVVAFGIGIAIASALAFVALLQRNREQAARRTAESRLVASQALAKLESDLDLGTSLALAAYRIKSTSEARSSVLVAARRSDHLLSLLDPSCADVDLVRFSADGRLVAAGCKDGTVLVWEPERQRPVPLRRAGGAAISTLAFSPDAKLLATTDQKQLVQVWRIGGLRSHKPVRTPPGLKASAVAFAPDGALVLGMTDRVASWRPGRRLHRVAPVRYPVEKLAVADDGTIAAGGVSGVTVLVPRNRRPPGSLPVGGDEIVQDLAFAPAGRRLAIVEGLQALIWDPERKKLSRLPVTGAKAVAFGPRGDVAVGSLDGDLVIWDREGKRRPPVFRFRRGAAVSSIAFDRLHNRIASAGSGRIALWAVDRSQQRRSLSTPLPVLDALVVTGPRSILVGGDGHVVQKEVMPDSAKTLKDAPGGHISLASSENGRVVVAGGSQTIVIWTPNGRQGPLSRRGDTPVAVAASADGATVAQATQHGTLNLWTWRSRQTRPEVLRVSREALKTVTAAPSGQLFAVGAEDGTVWLVDASKKRNKRIGKLEQASVEAVAFAGGDDRIAAAGTDGTVTVWGVRSSSKQVYRARDTSLLGSVAVDPKGATIAAGDQSGNVFLWDAHHGDQLGPPLALAGEVESVGFDPSGQMLAVGLHGGAVVLVAREAWDVAAAIDSLCTRVARC
jgi:WD40 repeat protein